MLAVGGLGKALSDPAIFRALSPTYGLAFFFDHPGIAFIALGAVVLTVTGAEALYADMGHFGRPPIRRAWFLLVFPALTLNYLGQARAAPGASRRGRLAVLPAVPGVVADPGACCWPRWRR